MLWAALRFPDLSLQLRLRGGDARGPVLVQALPGMETVATMMMKQKLKKHGVATLEELRDICLEADVKFIACQMTVDLFEFDKSEFIKDVEYGGAAMFFGFAGETDICLFV